MFTNILPGNLDDQMRVDGQLDPNLNMQSQAIPPSLSPSLSQGPGTEGSQMDIDRMLQPSLSVGKLLLSFEAKNSSLIYLLEEALAYVKCTIPYFSINNFLNEFAKTADASGTRLLPVKQLIDLADLVKATIEIQEIVRQACGKMNITPEAIGFSVFENGRFPINHTEVEKVYDWLLTNMNISVNAPQPSLQFLLPSKSRKTSKCVLFCKS